jgi:hypothetical protein
MVVRTIDGSSDCRWLFGLSVVVRTVGGSSDCRWLFGLSVGVPLDSGLAIPMFLPLTAYPRARRALRQALWLLVILVPSRVLGSRGRFHPPEAASFRELLFVPLYGLVLFGMCYLFEAALDFFRRREAHGVAAMLRPRRRSQRGHRDR